jgi:hypothetical protein
LVSGANTTIVGLLDTVLRRELPVSDPQELVFIRTAGDQGLGGAPPYPYFELVRHAGLPDGSRHRGRSPLRSSEYAGV